jgi:methyl-accepting chemotaxis protein
LIDSSSDLEINIKKSAFVIEETGRNNSAISERLKNQLLEIDNVTTKIAVRMESSSDKIPKEVLNQTAAVEETNRTVNGMNIHIEKIHRSIIQTDNISRELYNIAANSKDLVIKSRESVEKTSENTNFISEVLENIHEIVEESNFLSVNASIESSYAGEAGQGFSILASEIRNLANESKERLDMSQGRLKNMKLKINESSRLIEEVTKQLLTIIEKSKNSADMIEKISLMMHEHKLESTAILDGTGSLLKDTMSIRDMTEEDYKQGENLKQTLTVFKKSFEEMSRLINSHEESEKNICSAIDHMQEVLSENQETIAILKETLLIAGTENA